MDVESFDDGYLAAILTPEGESAAVGAPVGVLAATAADIPKVQAALKAGGGRAAPAAAAAAPAAAAPAPAAAAAGGAAMPAAAIAVMMPALSSTMKEGRITQWAKAVGEKVSSGDTLLVVESDKADMDVESFDDGYLAAILTPEGESAAVGNAVRTGTRGGRRACVRRGDGDCARVLCVRVSCVFVCVRCACGGVSARARGRAQLIGRAGARSRPGDASSRRGACARRCVAGRACAPPLGRRVWERVWAFRLRLRCACVAFRSARTAVRAPAPARLSRAALASACVRAVRVARACV
jgi:pyruvate dehydrogenase E2 component (dihydrolipoamide acetyltransferase)